MNGKKTGKIYAFIDGNNLYLGAKSQGIDIDYRKFRLYLKNKLGVDRAFLFIGYDPERTRSYSKLTEDGYTLVHKQVVVYRENGRRTMKGNVDAELVLHAAAIEYDNYDQAIIVTSDGDFACLIRFLLENDKLKYIITPTDFSSSLFRPFSEKMIRLTRFKRSIQK